LGRATFLQSTPAPDASTEDLIAVAFESAKLGGTYATHMRSEGDAIITAIDEVIRIAREAKSPAEIWHLKAAGKSNWGRMPEIVAHIEKARQAGLDITADTYAYPAWFNSFSAFIPPWAHDGGDAKLIERLKDPAMSARIRKEMVTPSTECDNEWQEIAGAEAILARCLAGACATLGVGMQRLARHRDRWTAGRRASASARLRNVPAHPSKIRSRGKQAAAGRGHPKIQRFAGPAHAVRGSWSVEERHVGRYRHL
jgi:hypothetical protein